MRFVQIVLTDAQARISADAANYTRQKGEEEGVLVEGEADQLERLAVFFAEVALNPSRHPVSTMGKTIKRVVRGVKGPAQKPKLNKRKARQEKRQGGAKRRRQERRELAENHNQAVAKFQADYDEQLAAYEAEGKRREVRMDALLGTGDGLSPEGVEELLELIGLDDLAVEHRQARNPEARLAKAAEQRKLVEDAEREAGL